MRAHIFTVITVVLLLMLPLLASAQSYAFVQIAAAATSSGTIETSQSSGPFSTNVTAGNLIVYFVTYHSSATAITVTVTDTLGNSYVQAGSYFNATDQTGATWGYAKNIAGGADTLTATFSGTDNANYARCIGLEYSGFDKAAPFTSGEVASNDQTFTSAPGTDAIATGNTPTLATQPAVIIGLAEDTFNGNASSAGTGFNTRLNGSTDPSGFTIEDKLLTSTAPVAATFSSTASTVSHFLSAALVLNEARTSSPPASQGFFDQ